jgi:hypothetical protein
MVAERVAAAVRRLHREAAAGLPSSSLNFGLTNAWQASRRGAFRSFRLAGEGSGFEAASPGVLYPVPDRWDGHRVSLSRLCIPATRWGVRRSASRARAHQAARNVGTFDSILTKRWWCSVPSRDGVQTRAGTRPPSSAPRNVKRVTRSIPRPC